ncbi:MAG: hypothetical protein IIB53_00095 [Planctomycetes bacterium]|nr:hypothetical protein [Planctomycetota bacterium]
MVRILDPAAELVLLEDGRHRLMGAWLDGRLTLRRKRDSSDRRRPRQETAPESADTEAAHP